MISLRSCAKFLFGAWFHEECPAEKQKVYNLFSIFRLVSIQIWVHPLVVHHREAPCKMQRSCNNLNRYKIKMLQRFSEPDQDIIPTRCRQILFQCVHADFYILANKRLLCTIKESKNFSSLR